MSLQHLGPINRFSEIDSTNRYLADEARKGVASGLVAVADHQSAGRGRLGRKWEAPPGANLLMSVLLRLETINDAAPFHLTAATALAAADACKEVAGVEPGLKWPNDLAVDHHKLAGILAEMITATRPQRDAVVVGLGLNVNWAPADEDLLSEERSGMKHPMPATSLAQLAQRPVDKDEVLTEVLEHLDQWITDLSKPNGGARLMDEYRARSLLIGKQVMIDAPGETAIGTVAGITDEGHLVVTTNEGQETEVNRVFTVGDVTGVSTIGLWPAKSRTPESPHSPAT